MKIKDIRSWFTLKLTRFYVFWYKFNWAWPNTRHVHSYFIIKKNFYYLACISRSFRARRSWKVFLHKIFQIHHLTFSIYLLKHDTFYKTFKFPIKVHFCQLALVKVDQTNTGLATHYFKTTNDAITASNNRPLFNIFSFDILFKSDYPN